LIFHSVTKETSSLRGLQIRTLRCKCSRRSPHQAVSTLKP
jgi:hypothetical protein